MPGRACTGGSHILLGRPERNCKSKVARKGGRLSRCLLSDAFSIGGEKTADRSKYGEARIVQVSGERCPYCASRLPKYSFEIQVSMDV